MAAAWFGLGIITALLLSLWMIKKPKGPLTSSEIIQTLLTQAYVKSDTTYVDLQTTVSSPDLHKLIVCMWYHNGPI